MITSQTVSGNKLQAIGSATEKAQHRTSNAGCKEWTADGSWQTADLPTGNVGEQNAALHKYWWAVTNYFYFLTRFPTSMHIIWTTNRTVMPCVLPMTQFSLTYITDRQTSI